MTRSGFASAKRTGGWQQEYGAAPVSTPIVRVDLSALPQDARAAAVAKRGSALQERPGHLEPARFCARRTSTSDPTSRAGCSSRSTISPSTASRGASWSRTSSPRTRASASGEPCSSRRGRRRSSAGREALEAHASSPDVLAHRSAGGRTSRTATPVPLPTDHERGANTRGDAHAPSSVSLDAAETRDLLQRVPGRLRDGDQRRAPCSAGRRRLQVGRDEARSSSSSRVTDARISSRASTCRGQSAGSRRSSPSGSPAPRILAPPSSGRRRRSARFPTAD